MHTCMTAGRGRQMTEPAEDRRKLSVWIPVRIHAEALYRADLSGKTLTEYVAEAIREKNEKEGKDE